MDPRPPIPWSQRARLLRDLGIIVFGLWGLLRQSVFLSMGAVPDGIEPEEVRAALAGLPGVAAVHDLHIWPMGTAAAVMTTHLVVAGGHPGDAVQRGWGA